MRPIVAVLPLLCSADAVAQPAEHGNSLREPQATGRTGSARLQVDPFGCPAYRRLRRHN